MSSTENGDMAFVEETMTEVRRNWNIMVQESVINRDDCIVHCLV